MLIASGQAPGQGHWLRQISSDPPSLTRSVDGEQELSVHRSLLMPLGQRPGLAAV
jgi:hypothetical protein